MFHCRISFHSLLYAILYGNERRIVRCLHVNHLAVYVIYLGDGRIRRTDELNQMPIIRAVISSVCDIICAAISYTLCAMLPHSLSSGDVTWTKSIFHTGG